MLQASNKKALTSLLVNLFNFILKGLLTLELSITLIFFMFITTHYVLTFWERIIVPFRPRFSNLNFTYYGNLQQPEFETPVAGI